MADSYDPTDPNSILNTFGALAPIFSNAAASSARGRAAEAQVNQNQANTANNLYRTQLQAALEGPSISAAQAAKGDYLAHVQPFSFTGGTTMVGNIPVPVATGGLNPSVFGPNTRAAGQALSALGASRVGAFGLPTAPTLAPAPQPSGFETASGVLGTAGSIAGAIAKAGLLGLGGGGGSSDGSDGDTGPASIPGGSTDPADAAHNNAENNPDLVPATGGSLDELYARWLAAQGDQAAQAGGYQ
jgi:hypothetical protein